MIGWYPPLNDLSDLTWHMFTHVVETNQHSLYNIFVNGVHILLMLVSNVNYA